MILIGTSGSSKCDWQLVQDSEKVLNLSSNGINPYFHDQQIIEDSLNSLPELISHKERIEVVKYIEVYLECFSDHKKHQAHFVGSIPFYFEEILREIVELKEIRIGKIIKEPIERLVKYHINKHYTS